MTLKALIFDMDGTLTDSDPLHRRAFAETLRPHGLVIDEDVYRTRISGRLNAVILADLLPHLSTAEHERIAQAKEAAFHDLAHEQKPLAGLADLLDWADANGVALGLVTNAPMPNVHHTLKALALETRFPVQVSGEDLARAKPDPLPYLTGLRHLGVQADEAVAFEDSRSGVVAARAAGLFTFGLLTGQTAETLREAGADAVIPDFHDQGLWDLLRRRRGEPDRTTGASG